jgi:precorrin-6A/cobalt-precorrin-6A reductase
MSARERPHLLILGGTGEATALAAAALARFGDRLAVTTSLAGRTDHPAPLPGASRIGGFGGAEGLAAYLRAEKIDLLVDATHPFAWRMSRQARLAADDAGVPRLLLLRPPWPRHPDDQWLEVDDMDAAASMLPRLGRRVLLTVGTRDLAVFSACDGLHFVVRLVDPPRGALPLASAEVILGRGPFDLAEERRLLAYHRIEVLVSKASGGDATAAKLVAAREAHLPVVMVRRPTPEPGSCVDSVAAALDWLAVRLALPQDRGAKEAFP